MMLSFLGSFYSVLLNRLKLQRHKRRAQYKPQKRDIIVSGKKKTFIIQKIVLPAPGPRITRFAKHLIPHPKSE